MTPSENDRNKRSGLSSRESRALARLAQQNEEIFGIDDLAEALDTSYDAAKATASRLAKNGWLTRLKPGRYLIVPLAAGENSQYTAHEFYIAKHLAEPMYIGYWSALNYHGFTEQVPRSVYLATTKRLSDITIHGVQYHRVSLAERKFFGYEEHAIGSHQVPISTPEKTIVDCADLPRHSGGIRELAKGIRLGQKAYDPETVLDYARRIDNDAAVKRLVYLMDYYDVPIPNREDALQNLSAGSPSLDPTRSERGTHSAEYRLWINIPESHLPK